MSEEQITMHIGGSEYVYWSRHEYGGRDIAISGYQNTEHNHNVRVANNFLESRIKLRCFGKTEANGIICECKPDFWTGRMRFRGKINFHAEVDICTLFFRVVPYILILSKSFIYQLMHNRVALKEY